MGEDDVTQEDAKDEASRTVRWGRLLRLFAYVAGGLFCLLLMAGGLEAWRGASQLSRLLSEGRQAGEVFEVAELMPSIPDPDQNAATPLLMLTNQLREADDVLRSGPPLWLFDEQRQLRSLASIESWERKRSILSDGPASNNWTAFAVAFKELEPLADQVQTVVERPAFQSGFDYPRGFKEIGLIPLMVERARVGDLLAFSFVHHVRLGAKDTAKERLQALVKWGGMQKGDGLILSELIRYRGLEKAIRSVRHGLGELPWSDDELAQLRRLVEGWDLIGGIVRAYELERAMSLDFLHAAAHDVEVREQQLELWQQIHDNVGPGFLPTPDFWWRRVRLPLWSMIWWRQESARSLQQWDLMIRSLREMRGLSLRDSKEHWLALPRTHRELFLDRDELEGLDRWRFIFVSEFSFMEGMPPRVLKLETERQLLLAAIAIRRFFLRQADVPNELAELSPDFLAETPVDAMNGAPVRYRRTGKGTFLLYSVGENGADDGGDARPRVVGKFSGMWDGRDACWPIAAPEESRQGIGRVR